MLGPFPNEANTGYSIATPVSQRGRDRIYHCMARFPTKPVLHLLLHGPFPNEASTGYTIAWPVSQRSRYWRHPDNQLRNHSITPRRRTTSQPPPHGEVLARGPPRSCVQDHTSHTSQSQVTSHKSQYRRQALNQSNNMSVADRFEPIRQGYPRRQEALSEPCLRRPIRLSLSDPETTDIPCDT